MSKRLKRKSPVVPSTKPAAASGPSGVPSRRSANRPEAARRPRWIPYAIGGAIILLVVIAAILIGRSTGNGGATTPTVPPTEVLASTGGTPEPGVGTPEEVGTPTGAIDTNRPFAAAPPDQRNGLPATMPAMSINPSKQYTATIRLVKGNIVIKLRADKAPQTVNNFVSLARQGYYDGLTFHRVETDPSFQLIQGGDPIGTGTGGPAYTVPAEIGLPHTAGAIAMARTGDEVNPTKASSGSQFYITLVPIPSLNGGYTVFGEVVSGLDIAKQVKKGDTIQRIDITES